MTKDRGDIRNEMCPEFQSKLQDHSDESPVGDGAGSRFGGRRGECGERCPEGGAQHSGANLRGPFDDRRCTENRARLSQESH